MQQAMTAANGHIKDRFLVLLVVVLLVVLALFLGNRSSTTKGCRSTRR